jgi:hypothetical protein
MARPGSVFALFAVMSEMGQKRALNGRGNNVRSCLAKRTFQRVLLKVTFVPGADISIACHSGESRAMRETAVLRSVTAS